MCVSGDLSQRIGPWGCGILLGKCEIRKAGVQAGTSGRSWPCCLEAEFLPPPGSLRFCSWGLCLSGWGRHSVEDDLLYLTSDDGCEPHPQTTFTATSRRVFGWITGDWPSQADTGTDHHCTCQAFCFEKSQHLYCYYCLLQSTWICIDIHYIWGAKPSREKGISLKDINL